MKKELEFQLKSPGLVQKVLDDPVLVFTLENLSFFPCVFLERNQNTWILSNAMEIHKQHPIFSVVSTFFCCSSKHLLLRRSFFPGLQGSHLHRNGNGIKRESEVNFWGKAILQEKENKYIWRNKQTKSVSKALNNTLRFQYSHQSSTWSNITELSCCHKT